MTDIRLALACRSELLQEGLMELFKDRAPHIQIVARCSSGNECLKKAQVLKPDVILLDTNLKDTSAIEVSLNLGRLYPQTKILFFSSLNDGWDPLDAIKAGARGCISQDISISSLIDDIERTFSGEMIISSAMAEKIINEIRILGQKQPQEEIDSKHNLSKREYEVLALVAQGRTNDEIAKVLFITRNTVKAHLSHIMEKLHVRKRYQAALLYTESAVFPK